MITLDWKNEDHFDDMCKDMAAELRKDGLPIVVWGDMTEESFMPFFNEMNLVIDNLCDIKQVVRKIGKDGEEKKSIHPEEIDQLYTEYNAVILVPYPRTIEKEISAFKHKPRRIFYLDVAKLHLHPVLFRRPDRDNVAKLQKKLVQVEDILEDNESKSVLQNVLNYWISGEYSLVKQYSELQHKQYLDTVPFGKNEIFLNIGACDGRYTKRFIDLAGEYQAIYNFECDPVNFEKMKKNLCNYNNCFFEKKAIWNTCEKLKFNAVGNAGSYIGEDVATEIEADSIDHMFRDVPVSFIKADIEGAEYRLLEGAKNTIKKYRPSLAICCYHQMEDLIELPLKMKELNSDYKIKIRHYTDTLTETVCYAY